MKYGYVRPEAYQPIERQTDQLRAALVDRLVTEGDAADLLQQLQPGDTLVVVSLDRLAPSLPKVADVLAAADVRGIKVRSLDLLEVPAAAVVRYLSDCEKILAKEKQVARVRASPLKTVDDAEIVARLKAGETAVSIAAALGISRNTVANVAKRNDLTKKKGWG